MWSLREEGVISYQLSVFSFQFSVISFQLSVEIGDKKQLANKLFTVYCLLFTVYCLLFTVGVVTANCLLITEPNPQPTNRKKET